ncbi:Protein CBG22694 [Caenorhabditis briggsae]|uniref:Protein CBG22694 n=1 Tax=Caenorhabditis briggsae TaxID=6238 RepID=A8Y2Y9_CAEBR|nr:Protein CBG22694 [Caenorhabditis briggsae]CAP39230.2 Protein CBG22694 [Caenorhabditis briggsae]
MEVPTLFKIALKKCIVYHCNARIKVNENVPSKLKQILFNGMMNSLNPVHPSNYTVFSVEEVDLTHKLITEADVSEVAKCDLKKLKINCSLQKYRFANLGGYYIVVATSLYHGKWLHEILRYLPNLRTLVFEQANRTTFPTLSRTFHQMKSLNVSCDTLYDMKGISYFINLETLIMRNLTVYRQDDFHELFKLQNLRNLDLSRYKKRRDGECKTIEFMVKADEILPKLEYINCSYLHIIAVQLGELLMRNNTIQKICLFGTDCENIGDIEGVTVLTSVDLRASLKLLHHFHEQEQFSMMDRVFEKIKQFFLDGMDYNENQELLTTCFKTFVNHIDNTTPTEALARTDVCSAIKCLVTYCTLYNENVTQTQRSQIAQILLESPTEGFKCYWELFTGAKLHTVPGLNVIGYYQKVVAHISAGLGDGSWDERKVECVEDLLNGLQTINALYPKLDEQSRRQITEIPSLLPVFDLIFVECSELVEIWNGRRPLNNVYHLFDLVCTALRNIISGWDLRPEEYEQLHLSLLEVFAQNPNHPIMVNSLTGLIEIVRNRMH